MEKKDTLSSSTETKYVHAIKYKMSKAKERCMVYFRSLHSHLQVLSKDDLKGTRIEYGFKRAFMSLFGQDVDTFTSTMLLNVDQLQKQLDKDEFQEEGSMAAFWVYDRRVNKRQMQTQVSKIDTGKAVDADLVDTGSIRTDSNTAVIAGSLHTEQPEIIVEGRVDQYPETCQVKSPMLDSSPDNQTTEYSKQSLESENILLKETVAQFQKDFSRMEAHCIALELKYQNQSLKSGQHGQILNETSNKAKIEKEIDVLETMNIELEHSVATLRKENETLKQHYKDLYDSIKITRSKTTEQTTSLLANNAELKAQIQEKVFAIAALKNDLRKLKGNSVDTKFDKTSVLGKPVLPSLRNQSVVRQPNAFKSARAQMSKQRFASQVDVNKNLSKPVTQHYLPKKTESTFAKPDHMIASSSSRNSSKNMPRFSSNDMVHNHYLDVAKKKIQERDRNSTTSVPTSARIQTTTDDRKPNPRSNNQTSRSLPVSKSSRVTITAVPKADHSKSSSSFSDSKNFVCSTCHKCVFNANHDACITKLLKEVNSRAKIQSNKTTNSNKPVDQKSHTQKPSRQIFTGHRFSPNKTSAVSEKTSPRSDLRWKPTGRIFKSVGLRWIPTGKLFDSCTSKVDSEPSHGSNVDIPHIHECKQTLDVSAGTSINVQKEQSLDLSAGTLCNVNKDNLTVWLVQWLRLNPKKRLVQWLRVNPNNDNTTSTGSSSSNENDDGLLLNVFSGEMQESDKKQGKKDSKNIMNKVDIEDLTIEQYLRLTQESQTPKKIEDMTIVEYLEYEKKVNENHISHTKSYPPTYFGKSKPTHDPIWEFAHYFDPNQPGAESDCDLEDMEEGIEYMTDDEVEMKGGIMKKQFEALTASVSDEVSSIASNKVDRADDNTPNTAPCRLTKELSPRSFLLPFSINSHNLYATATLDAKDNFMP
ncbi:hypothetical protein Tco_1312381 [Tanacetum coccineum]